MPKPDETVEEKVDDASRVQSAVETALTGDTEDETDNGTDDDNTADDNTDEEESKSTDDDSASDDSDDDKKSDDDEEKTDDDSKEEDSAVERKFKNLAADDDATYIKNIESAYQNSSAEAIRLNQELSATNRRVDAIVAAAQKDPDLAKRLNDVLGIGGNDDSSGSDTQPTGSGAPKPTDDPFLVNSKTEWENKSRTEVEEILAANPEINSDPKLNTQVKHWMEVFSNEEFNQNRRLMSGGEAMEAAMKHLGIEDRRKKQDVANGVKDLAAPTRPTKSRTPKPKAKGLSDAAADFADKLGVAREKAEKYAN